VQRSVVRQPAPP